MHVHGEIWTLKELFTYPNEYIYWSIHIALYPYITGLVAGAFVLSSLYHVFGKKELKPVAKFSLVFSFALLLIAPTPLLFHLTQPQRAFNLYFTPHFYSAIAAFGVVYLTYMFIVLGEIWFSYRRFIIEQAQTKTGFLGLIYKILTLGSYDVSYKALQTDEKLTKILAAIGVPAAAFLHGYVGFIFGSVKTVALWKTPLMPFIFLMSAIISGVALCIVVYIICMKLMRKEICKYSVKSMCNVLAIFLVISFILESIDIVFHGYLAEESWGILSVLLFDKIGFNMFGLQWGLGMILPFILLLSKKVGTKRAFIASLLVLIGVFAMRVNVVIGGQSMSKSLAGFMQYDFPILPTNLETFKEGLSAVVILSAMPFILFYIFNKILPVFSKGKTITAEDLMTHTPITVSADASASEAASFALVKHLACLPVVDSEGKVVGQVTQTQLINMNKEKDKVKDIMVKAVTVHEDASAKELRKIIVENNVDGLVVVSEDNEPLGVISKLDIVRFVEAGETCCV